MKTPLFLALISFETWEPVANLNPFGKITIPPTFKSAFLPTALSCWRLTSYGTFTSISNTEFGSTAWGASISIVSELLFWHSSLSFAGVILFSILSSTTSSGALLGHSLVCIFISFAFY